MTVGDGRQANGGVCGEIARPRINENNLAWLCEGREGRERREDGGIKGGEGSTGGGETPRHLRRKPSATLLEGGGGRGGGGGCQQVGPCQASLQHAGLAALQTAAL